MSKLVLTLVCSGILFIAVKYVLAPLIGAWAFALLFGAVIGVCIWQWVVTPIRTYRGESRFQPRERNK